MRQRALDYATQNTIRGAPIVAGDVVIEPNTARYTVYVRIHHPFVALLMGRIFLGFYSVSAAATAEAAKRVRSRA